MRKIRILVANPPEEINGITWWRVFRPFMLLARKYPELEIRFNPGGLFDSDFLFTDIVFAYRPTNPEHAPILAKAREWCRVIVDYDDDMLNVPLGHPLFREFVGRADFVNSCIALADEVWLSTEQLKKVYSEANRGFLSRQRGNQNGFVSPNFTVIPNAVLPSDLPEYANGNTKFALWRGGDLHIDDLELWRGQYGQILRAVNAFQWALYMPSWGRVADYKGRIDYMTDYVPTDKWISYLCSLRPSIVWKPLVPNEFNRGKSNIAWLEATCAGAICLTNLAGQTQWEFCTKDIPKFDEYYIKLWQQSADEIRQRYDLTAWNEVRYRQILKLVNNDYEKENNAHENANGAAVADTA